MSATDASQSVSTETSAPPSRDPFRVIYRWWLQRARSVEHQEVLADIDADGSLRSNYLFMCVMAAGIAITGLLLNSPAVIIGAMLVSPLMGPIARIGMGIATLDYRRAAGGSLALIVGMGLSLLMAMLIVKVSPIRELTPEILARTNPNLFDLLVAVLSGLAGGYAMVRGRGGTIVGVAIATALMPPMTVIGYGLASEQWPVARGALLLFTTNLVAIALSFAAIGLWYGFSRRAWRTAMVWQSGLALALVLPLLAPLFQSLQAITRESQLQGQVRAAIREELSDRRFRIIGLSLATPEAGVTRVDLTLAIDRFEAELTSALQDRLQQTVQGELRFNLTPVVMAEPERPAVAQSALANPVVFTADSVAPPSATVLPEQNPMQALIDGFPLPLLASKIDPAAKQLRLVMDQAPELGFAALQRIENELQARHTDWNIELVPPTGVALRVHFTVGSIELDPARQSDMARALWALKRWRVSTVAIEGRASSDGDGPATLAQRRADVVAELLRQQGISVLRADGRYPYPQQSELEAKVGKDVLRSVLIIPHTEPALDEGVSQLLQVKDDGEIDG